jgi:hypothetical protein
MPGSYWECPRCGALNKAFAAVCFTCGGNTRREAVARQRAADPERFHMTRGSRLLLVVAMALAALVGFALVRTFRSPALEQAAAAPEPEAGTAREPVPPDATMPGAPDSGWAAATQAASPAPPPTVETASQGPSAGVSVAPAAEPRRRSYTDTDLRTIVARRGLAATHDRDYLLALRQRRVDDLRERLADARSGDERAKLQDWLDGALADLERAR